MPILPAAIDPHLDAWPHAGIVGILDLEFTAWEGSVQRNWGEAWEWREIVQIGFALVDSGDAFAVRDGIELMVRPERNPTLSDYFVRLTGITQANLDANAVAFSHALAELERFAPPGIPILFNGGDGQILRENCDMRGLPPLWTQERTFNIRPLLSRTLDRPFRDLVSSALPALAGIALTGRAHTALADCEAIAAALGTWRRSGVL
jgi:inhibitor of KinA sporulation pathway (predicted exonuclease)